MSLRDFLQMFISDWKSIRCEEVLKKYWQDQSHNPEFLRCSLRTSERSLPNPPYSVKQSWGDFSGREVRVSFMGNISTCGWNSLALFQISCYPSITSVEPPKKRLIALAVEDLVITFFYLAQSVAWVLPQIKHKISKPFHLFSKN